MSEATPGRTESAESRSSDTSRDETPAERVDRHWNEMLQELRVTQTGVQVLFAFLLVLPFQQRFGDLGDFSRILFVVVVCLAAVSTALTLAPVITHRFLYTKHKKDILLTVSDALTKASFISVGLTLTGALVLVIDMVLNRTAAYAIVGGIAIFVLLLWVVIPGWLLRRHGDVPSAY